MDFLFCIDLVQLVFFGFFVIFHVFTFFRKTASPLLEADEPNSRILASAAITGPSVSRHNRQAIGIKIATRRVRDHTKPPCEFVQDCAHHFWETVGWSGEMAGKGDEKRCIGSPFGYILKIKLTHLWVELPQKPTVRMKPESQNVFVLLSTHHCWFCSNINRSNLSVDIFVATSIVLAIDSPFDGNTMSGMRARAFEPRWRPSVIWCQRLTVSAIARTHRWSPWYPAHPRAVLLNRFPDRSKLGRFRYFVSFHPVSNG